jgi:aminopeptidase N
LRLLLALTPRRLLLALLLLTPGPAGGQDVGIPSVATDGYERDRGVDILHYDLELVLPDAPGPISARARIVAERLEADLDALRLDFAPLEIDGVRVDGAEASWVRDDGALVITLPPAQEGARHELDVRYHGTPRDGLILKNNRHGEFAVFADNWPDRAREWFPAVDHPSDKATVAFDVIAPAAWRVVANGYLVDRTDVGGGRARTRWRETAEVPTYTMVIGASRFAIEAIGERAGVAVSHWTFPQDSAAGSAAFARSGEILAVYDSLFGPFPYEKLAHVQSATRYGGMENSSAIFYSENRIGEALDRGEDSEDERLDGLTSLVAHETVHQWFGDAVTEKDWHHLWLSEGFATYFAEVFFELRGSSEGSGPAELARGMRALRDEVIAWDNGEGAGLAIVDPRPVASGNYEELLHTGNYQKGGWVLHMLRREVGDVAFFEGVQAYYAAHRDGTAWTADFERTIEEASGKDLGWFFAQWIGRPGHPVLAVATESRGPASRIVVRQVQPEAPWSFALDLELHWPGGHRTERLEVTDREASIEVTTPAPVERVTLDPGIWLLFEPFR